MRSIISLLCLGILGGSLCPAQSCRCDWSVNAGAGGDMSSAAYRCGATAGQTAAGTVTSNEFLAFIGFWQADCQTGIRDERPLPAHGTIVTRLDAIAPNPFRAAATIRYTLAADQPVTLRVHDLTGRVVRTLCASNVTRGAYSTHWDGRDDAGRLLTPGIYFCRFAADDVLAIEKVVLAR